MALTNVCVLNIYRQIFVTVSLILLKTNTLNFQALYGQIDKDDEVNCFKSEYQTLLWGSIRSLNCS